MQFKHKRIDAGKGEFLLDVIVWVLVLSFCFLCLYPFWYVIVASFNDGYDMMLGGVYFWPRRFTLENYTKFFSQASWLSAIGVSVTRTAVGAVLTTLFTCLVSYALSRKSLMGGRGYRFLFVFCMYVSGGLIPFYMILRFMGLINTFWVYIIPNLLNLFFVMVGMNFFRSIPEALFEVSHLDGAAEHTIFVRIVLPLSKPFLATLVLFTAVNQWNSWIDSVYYVNDKQLRPMAYWMVSLMNRSQSMASNQSANALTLTELSAQATAVVATVTPILFIYPFLQKYFVKGMMVGSVKE